MRLTSLPIAKLQLELDGEDMVLVDQILKATSPDHGHVLFTHAPKEVMWWVRTMGSISIQWLLTAIHETNHAVNSTLTNCNAGEATYSFQGRIIKTEHKSGDTPRYAVLADALPPAFKSRQVGSRYPTYIERNGASPASSFAHLLEELVVYTGAAGVELSIVRSKDYKWLLPREIDAFDGNAGGMVDFMLYAVSYLKAVRISHPDAYARLQQQPNTLSVLQATWTAAEGTLRAIYDYTRLANLGGVLIVSRDALLTTYSDDFLAELDRLGIAHAPAGAWLTTYLRNPQ
ncbi:MAG: hypothetical protein Q8M25_16845 [Rhodoferax sp.]|nr:hypothetical protein [Rhodoferax sp.]